MPILSPAPRSHSFAQVESVSRCLPLFVVSVDIAVFILGCCYMLCGQENPPASHPIPNPRRSRYLVRHALQDHDRDFDDVTIHPVESSTNISKYVTSPAVLVPTTSPTATMGLTPTPTPPSRQLVRCPLILTRTRASRVVTVPSTDLTMMRPLSINHQSLSSIPRPSMKSPGIG